MNNQSLPQLGPKNLTHWQSLGVPKKITPYGGDPAHWGGISHGLGFGGGYYNLTGPVGVPQVEFHVIFFSASRKLKLGRKLGENFIRHKNVRNTHFWKVIPKIIKLIFWTSPSHFWFVFWEKKWGQAQKYP